MKRLFEIKQPLATRLFRSVFLLYFGFAFALTLLQIGYEYDRAEKDSIKQLQIIADGQAQSIELAVWRFGFESLYSSIQFALKSGLYDGIVVFDRSGGVFAQAGTVFSADISRNPIIGDHEPLQTLALKSEPAESLILARSVMRTPSLRGTGPQAEIGIIHFYMKQERVLAMIGNSVAIIVINACLKALALWAIFRFFLNRIVRKPLSQLIKIAQETDFSALVMSHEHPPQAYFADGLGHKHADELRSLAKAFDHAVSALVSSKELIRTVSVLAGGLAHDIRNPLSIIDSYLYLIRNQIAHGNSEASGQEQLSTYLDRAEEASQIIGQIINSILHLIRTQNGQDKQEVKVASIVDQALQMCDLMIHKNGIVIKNDARDVGTSISCYEVQLLQILMNLIHNATNAVSASGDRWIRIEAHEDHDYAKIMISDSGKILSTEQAEDLIQTLSVPMQETTIAGIGLSLSAYLAAKNGGQLYFDAFHPHTRFVLKVPKQKTA